MGSRSRLTHQRRARRRCSMPCAGPERSGSLRRGRRSCTPRTRRRRRAAGLRAATRDSCGAGDSGTLPRREPLEQRPHALERLRIAGAIDAKARLLRAADFPACDGLERCQHVVVAPDLRHDQLFARVAVERKRIGTLCTRQSGHGIEHIGAGWVNRRNMNPWRRDQAASDRAAMSVCRPPPGDTTGPRCTRPNRAPGGPICRTVA